VKVFRAIELVDLALQSNSLPAVLTPGANNAARALVTSLVFVMARARKVTPLGTITLHGSDRWALLVVNSLQRRGRIRNRLQRVIINGISWLGVDCGLS